MAFSSIGYIGGAEVLVPPLVTASPAERKRLLGNAFVLRQAASVLAYICLLIFAWVAEDRGNFLLIVLMGSMMLWTESFIVTTVWFQSQTNIKPRSVLSFTSLLVKLAFIFILYKSGVKNIIYYTFAYLLDSVIMSAGMFFIYYKKTGEFFFSYRKSDAIGILKKSLPFLMGLITMSFYQRIDILILKNLTDSYNVGIYTAAMQLVTPVAAIASMFSFSLAPKYVYSQKSQNVAYKNVGIIAVIMLATSLVLVLLASLVGGFLIKKLFGSRFEESITSFNYLIWIVCPIFIDSALNILLIKKQLGKHVAYKWTIALFVSAIVHISCIPRYQNYGAFAGCMAGYLTLCVYGVCFYFYSYSRASKSGA